MKEPSTTPSGRARLSLGSAAREVLLIVVGVLLALSLEALWQYRGERTAEGALLEGLRAELAANLESLERTLGAHGRVARSGEELIRRLEGARDGELVMMPDSLLGDVARTPRYRPDMNTLDAAISSGQISLIQALEVQRSLASWRGRLLEAQQEEQAGADFLYAELLPRLGAAGDLGPSLSWLADDLERLGQQDRPPRPASSSQLTASQELTNLAWVRYRLSRAALNELGLLQSRLEEVLASLELELQ